MQLFLIIEYTRTVEIQLIYLMQIYNSSWSINLNGVRGWNPEWRN